MHSKDGSRFAKFGGKKQRPLISSTSQIACGFFSVRGSAFSKIVNYRS